MRQGRHLFVTAAAIGLALAAAPASARVFSPDRLRDLQTGYSGQGTRDGECLRDDAGRHQPTVQTLRDCGHPIPDLTNEPDQQQRVADVGGPFLATALGRDGRDHWYVCGMEGSSPSGSPTSNAPYRCRWLGRSTPHVGDLRTRTADPFQAAAG